MHCTHTFKMRLPPHSVLQLGDVANWAADLHDLVCTYANMDRERPCNSHYSSVSMSKKDRQNSKASSRSIIYIPSDYNSFLLPVFNFITFVSGFTFIVNTCLLSGFSFSVIKNLCPM